MTTEQTAFLEILLFVIGALLFLSVGSLVSAWLRPHRPNIEKLSTYESGEAPTGSAWGPFNVHFYKIGLIFLIFEAETVLLFPWAVVWGNQELHQASGGLWTRYMALAGTVFILVLLIGLIYVGAQGHLTWTRPKPLRPSYPSKVPIKYYEAINQYYASASRQTTTQPR